MCTADCVTNQRGAETFLDSEFQFRFNCVGFDTEALKQRCPCPRWQWPPPGTAQKGSLCTPPRGRPADTKCCAATASCHPDACDPWAGSRASDNESAYSRRLTFSFPRTFDAFPSASSHKLTARLTR
eukprot:1524566-Amphidinium_carterae.2